MPGGTVKVEAVVRGAAHTVEELLDHGTIGRRRLELEAFAEPRDQPRRSEPGMAEVKRPLRLEALDALLQEWGRGLDGGVRRRKRKGKRKRGRSLARIPDCWPSG